MLQVLIQKFVISKHIPKAAEGNYSECSIATEGRSMKPELAKYQERDREDFLAGQIWLRTARELTNCFQ